MNRYTEEEVKDRGSRVDTPYRARCHDIMEKISHYNMFLPSQYPIYLACFEFPNFKKRTTAMLLSGCCFLFSVALNMLTLCVILFSPLAVYIHHSADSPYIVHTESGIPWSKGDHTHTTSPLFFCKSRSRAILKQMIAYQLFLTLPHTHIHTRFLQVLKHAWRESDFFFFVPASTSQLQRSSLFLFNNSWHEAN